MKVIYSVTDMYEAAMQVRSRGERIGFVPTMGFLHDGHLSLIKKARSVSDWVVVSIFVNPTQFCPGEDYERYPRDMRRDVELCRNEGAHIVFAPEAVQMYAADHAVYVEESDFSSGLCGALRPGHFRGVATVVAKLFNIVQPHVAVFGMKDAQQLRVIERMTRDLNFPVEIVAAPIVREPDGLAMSSRNKYLTPESRSKAVRIYESLRHAERLYQEGMRDAGAIRDSMASLLQGATDLRIDYIATVDYETLKPVDRIERAALVAVAVRIGGVRLIDNTVIPYISRET